MLLIQNFLHFGAAVFVLLLSSLGLSFGISKATDGLFIGATRQIAAMSQLSKIVMYGMLLIEGSFIMAFIIAISIIFPVYSALTLPIALGELGMAIAVGLCSLMVGCASSFAVYGACGALARQPFFLNKIQMLTVIVQTLIETPVFFAFIIALLIKIKLNSSLDLVDGMRLLAAGSTIGLVAIGPSIGQLIFCSACCLAPGINRYAYNKIFTFTIITEALIETPLLFAFVLAILILFKKITMGIAMASGILFVIPIVMCLGAIGTGSGIGFVAAKSIREIAATPENYTNILRLSVLGQIFIESSIIFSFIIVLLIFFQAS